MEKLKFDLFGSDNSIGKLKLKINEIVDWINKHEKNPPYVKPPVIGA